MIRKWSYINNTLITLNSFYNLNLRYNLKIFRQNTRFKNVNQGFTNFSRKAVVLRHRRLGWKVYFIISSVWSKYTLVSKKLISFIQVKLITNFTLTFPYTNMFKTGTNRTKLIGVGENPINLVFYKKLFYKKFSKKERYSI
jgi:hypothetical protein